MHLSDKGGYYLVFKDELIVTTLSHLVQYSTVDSKSRESSGHLILYCRYTIISPLQKEEKTNKRYLNERLNTQGDCP